MYQDDVMRITIHILNKNLNSSMDNITPYMEWYDKKPSVKYFRVFGYLAYAHIPYESSRKFDHNSQACIFIGYYEKTKAYRFYNPKIYMVIFSRYVIFNGGEEQDHQKLIFDDGSNDDNSSKVHPNDQTNKKALPF